MDNSTEDYANYTYEYEEYGDVEDLKVDHSQTEAIHIISVVVYIFCIVLGLIGNGAVIWVTGFKSKRTINSVWLLNLAVADFVFVLFLPLYIDYILRDFHWNFGLTMCKMNSFVSVMNMYASVLFLTVLSVDRYVSVVHLNWCQRYRTVDRAWLVCGLVWLAAALLSCHALIFRDTMRFGSKVVCYMNYHMTDRHTAAAIHAALVSIRTTVGFLLPLTAISVTGILLAIQMKQSQGFVRVSSFSKTVTAVILAFFFCWAPFHIFSLMELFVHSSISLHVVLRAGFPLATSLGFFNSCINPLLYVLLSKKVRHILKVACLNLSKSSLRELSQSISATDVETVHDAPQDGFPDESTVSSHL
ncbi:G-protein coupled receptor 1 [Fundulus heteroclitus]|uniref:G-protein coupled receptor 1 n=1 Tax=Fundulus heteroclitus TaxID=8078 RepID=UPI00165A91DC|nr:G-protein coupled receptor 1 [Fundulus heteroclitus]XP_035995237.1 G-protein coupled receptor 1 [Fundulus heteroclitus]